MIDPPINPWTSKPTGKPRWPDLKLHPEPEFTYQAMGAGVQSTTIALLAASGVIEKPKYAVFVDTGWERKETYDHLDKLNREVLRPAGIELHRISRAAGKSSFLQDVQSQHAPELMPLHIKDPRTGKEGFTRRKCTSVYKIAPMKRWVRVQLGAEIREQRCTYCDGLGTRNTPWLVAAGEVETSGPCWPCEGTGTRQLVSQIPDRSAWTRCYIGFSTDELGRVGASPYRYVVNHYPLLDLRMSRDDCYDYLSDQGWGKTPRSNCIGCPFHTNAEWRRIKADPAEWANAVEVDESIRRRPGRRANGYLHRSRVPLAIADISTGGDDELGSCSPYGCRSGDTNFADLDDQLSLFE